MKYLAIDYGTKRIGLAVNHEWLAEPLEVVLRDKAGGRVPAVIHDLKIEAVLIGISEGQMAEDARRFAREVVNEAKKLGAEVKLIEVDETLSSVETHQKLAMSSMPRSRRQQPIDHYAAAAFLQDYLDLHRE
jgi:putative transcription antitermination factor YqgF